MWIVDTLPPPHVTQVPVTPTSELCWHMVSVKGNRVPTWQGINPMYERAGVTHKQGINMLVLLCIVSSCQLLKHHDCHVGWNGCHGLLVALCFAMWSTHVVGGSLPLRRMLFPCRLIHDISVCSNIILWMYVDPVHTLPVSFLSFLLS